MKKASLALYFFAVLFLCVSLWRGGFLQLLTFNSGTRGNDVAVSQQGVKLTLVLSGAGNEGARVSVLLNGKPVATFATGEVSLLVRDQDKICIDSDLPSKLRVEVSYASPEITLPRAGDHVFVQNTVETLGSIIIRRRSG